MTKERLAMLLDGNEYLEEMTREQERIAAENNLLVLFCQSDDLLEMRGAIHDEEDAMDGGELSLLQKGEQFYEEEDKETIRFYEENINDIDDLELYINENTYGLIEMLNSSIFFTSLDSSEQRRILNDCKIKYDYLKQVSKLHILDYLYYAAPLTLHEF